MSKVKDIKSMQRIKLMQEKMTAQFIDYCNVNNINLQQWYRWQLHLIWQRRKDGRTLKKS
jgi:uncharacterized protein YjaG (DUF416 family)